MVDETVSGGGSIASICPWCSASYDGDPERCPSCNATLTGDAATDQSLPGLTAIDAAAIVRSKETVKKPRNRLLSWISGEYPDQGSDTVETGALAPPDLAVRREILRLELEAEVASLQAEADAMRADVIVESLDAGATPEEIAAAVVIADDLSAVSDDLEATGAELEVAPMDELAEDAAEALDAGALPDAGVADAALATEAEAALDDAAAGDASPSGSDDRPA
jgi:hypothetical protein